MKKISTWLIIIVSLQIAWMAGTATVKELDLRRGTTVLLETAPVDPRDFLSGDYVILGYKISSIPTASFNPNPFGRQPISTFAGRDVYVALKKIGEFHQLSRASVNPLAPANGEIIVKGKIAPNQWQSANVRVNFGLEKYFVPEGTGNPRGKLTVQAAIGPDGTAVIKQVYIDGKPYADVMRSQK
jgi:uncharacterized membrane-anchored protein